MLVLQLLSRPLLESCRLWISKYASNSNKQSVGWYSGNYCVDSTLVSYLAAVASFAQVQTAFLSFSVSLASGCIALYSHGGILPVDISPQMDSNLSCLCHCE